MSKRPVTDIQKARLLLFENRQWVDSNISQLQKEHKGKWILILDKKLVKVGETPEEVKPHARGREEEALIMKVPSETPMPI